MAAAPTPQEEEKTAKDDTHDGAEAWPSEPEVRPLDKRDSVTDGAVQTCEQIQVYPRRQWHRRCVRRRIQSDSIVVTLERQHSRARTVVLQGVDRDWVASVPWVGEGDPRRDVGVRVQLIPTVCMNPTQERVHRTVVREEVEDAAGCV